MHDVVGQVVHPHGLEGAGAHVQGDESAAYALRRELIQHGLVEVQAGGGRGHGAGLAGVDGLVAAVVVGLRAVRDVGRQRRGAVGIEQVEHRLGKAQVEEFALAAQHLHVEGAGQAQGRAGAGGFAGAHVGQGPGGLDDAFDQHLDFAAGGFLARQARLDDARVVKDEQVVFADKGGEVWELQVVQLTLAVQVQQAAAAPLGGRVLGDELAGEVVVEVGQGKDWRLGRRHAGMV